MGRVGLKVVGKTPGYRVYNLDRSLSSILAQHVPLRFSKRKQRWLRGQIASYDNFGQCRIYRASFPDLLARCFRQLRFTI